MFNLVHSTARTQIQKYSHWQRENDEEFPDGNGTLYNITWPEHELACVFEESPGNFLNTGLFQTIVYVLYSAVFLVALVGNGLVCFVVHTSPRMKTVTNYFIVNLAVGDILMTVFCVPFSFVPVLVLRYWPFGAVMCSVVNYSQAVSVLVSAYTLLAISIDRYLAILRPLKPRLGKTAAKGVVVAVWTGALVTASPILIVSQLHKPSLWHLACDVAMMSVKLQDKDIDHLIWVTSAAQSLARFLWIVVICVRDICSEKWSNAKYSERYTLALLTLQFALPLAALVWTYGRIAFVVWGVKPPGEAQSDRDSRMQSSKRKMVKMMVTVVAVFVVCWLPLNIFIMLWTIHGNDDEWSTWPGVPYVWFASHWLAMSHSCYNPIIYCYMNNKYRHGFKQALGNVMCIKLNSSNRSCHRSSICDGMPMSELVGVNALQGRRDTLGNKCRVSRATSYEECTRRCSRCTSIRKEKNVKCNFQPPARALSVRNEFK